MRKEHIRTYRIGDAADVRIIRYEQGEAIDLTPNYRIEYDRHAVKLEATVDVFRFEDGTIGWSAAANGQDAETARSLSLLLGLYALDATRDLSDPRSL